MIKSQGQGLGIFFNSNFGPSLIFTNDTLVNNSATDPFGGGAISAGSTTTITLENTLMYNSNWRGGSAVRKKLKKFFERKL